VIPGEPTMAFEVFSFDSENEDLGKKGYRFQNTNKNYDTVDR